MKSMILAAAAVLALGASPAAYAESEGGATATALQWQAANGNASVPATRWFAANAAQRQQLSHEYAGVVYPVPGERARG